MLNNAQNLSKTVKLHYEVIRQFIVKLFPKLIGAKSDISVSSEVNRDSSNSIIGMQRIGLFLLY